MTGRDIYEVWAPEGARWVEWVRPVPFYGIDENFKKYDLLDFIIPNISYYVTDNLKHTAIIIDLSGNEGIKEGLALAKLGFRPIPIYNGTVGQKGVISTVDNTSIKIGLIKGALELKKMNISNIAMPAFLLDSNRTNRFKMDDSIFDNSWDVYGQDIPSAEYFLKNDIKKIMVRAEFLQKDLKKILYQFQNKGIKIFLIDNYGKVKKVKLIKWSVHNDKF